MTEEENILQTYKVDNDYRLVRLKGKTCSVFLKNKQNQMIASLEGCQNEFTQIRLFNDKPLTEREKRYLLSYIRAKKSSVSGDIANVLGVSVVKYEDGREEYLSEEHLRKRIATGIDFAKIYVGHLSVHHLEIPDDVKNCTYYFENAEVSKLTIGENCQASFDFRDNEFIETIIVGEHFSGSILLSRSSVESLFIEDNCHMDLTINEAKKCFNIKIGDLFSGHVNISGSCLYALDIGYYSYAEFLLSDNMIKKEIVIGDSFRGDFYAVDQVMDLMKIGQDCKGQVKISGQNQEKKPCKVEVGDDFNGHLNLNGDKSVDVIYLGRKGGGKLDASHADNLKNITVGKDYSGKMNLDGSSVKHITVARGAKGRVNFYDCSDLKFLKATVDNKLFLDSNLPLQKVRRHENSIYYDFMKSTHAEDLPFYKRLYETLSNRWN